MSHAGRYDCLSKVQAGGQPRSSQESTKEVLSTAKSMFVSSLDGVLNLSFATCATID